MIPTVLDSNVITSGIAGAAYPDRIPTALLQLADERRYRLILSEYLIEEVVRSFAKRYFRRRFAPELVTQAVDLLRLIAELVVPAPQVVGVAPDPKDDPVLGTAVAGGALYVVTGDVRLRRLGTYQRIEIVTPAEFYAILQAAA